MRIHKFLGKNVKITLERVYTPIAGKLEKKPFGLYHVGNIEFSANMVIWIEENDYEMSVCEKALKTIDSRIAITNQVINDIESKRIDGCLECRKQDLQEFNLYRQAIAIAINEKGKSKK